MPFIMQPPPSVPFPIPRFSLQSVLEILGAPQSFIDELLQQNIVRDDLRRTITEAAPRKGGVTKLPPVTPELEEVWSSVLNTKLPSEPRRDPAQTTLMRPNPPVLIRSAVPDLQCDDPVLIAETLCGIQGISGQDFQLVIERLAMHGDLSTSYAIQMAKLIAKMLELHVDHPIGTPETQLWLCAIEMAKLEQACVNDHNDKGECKHVGIQGQSHLVFVCNLYKLGVASPEDYAQMLKSIVLPHEPCMCRLQALQIVVGSGDNRVYKHCRQDVSRVVDALRTCDREGEMVWELDGHKLKQEMLGEILFKIQGWKKM
ncbi:unnamed protein product [Peniophora sp. CBMAI 1063]|nr:unnamed protein product [Peniophora sp. CBMAI 1063]